jgi:hypothetical protein
MARKEERKVTRHALASDAEPSQEEWNSMSSTLIQSKTGRLKPWLTLTAALVTAGAMVLGATPAAWAQEEKKDEGVQVSGEVDVYAEYYNTNYRGRYNGNSRGDGTWSSIFANGADDTYSNIETRIREAELKFKKSTTVNESWKMVNEIEIELKPINAGRSANDYDVEEASAIFQHASGFHFDIGILEDKKLWEGGNTNETASEDAKGFDEQPSIRFGFKTGDLDIDVRYHSIFTAASAFSADTDGDGDDETFNKELNETLIRLQVEWSKKNVAEALLTYTIVNTENKEDRSFQTATDSLTGTELEEYEAAGLNSATVLGVGGVIFLGNIWPSLTYESYHFEEDDGDTEFDVSVITAGVTLAKLGPGNLLLEIESATSDISGDDVAFTQLSGEYHFFAGKSRFGPGFKYFSNDADEELTGTVVYFGGEWKF